MICNDEVALRLFRFFNDSLSQINTDQSFTNVLKLISHMQADLVPIFRQMQRRDGFHGINNIVQFHGGEYQGMERAVQSHGVTGRSKPRRTIGVRYSLLFFILSVFRIFQLQEQRSFPAENEAISLTEPMILVTVMTQTAPHIQITDAGKKPQPKKGPLTPAQQMEALRRVQAQAEQRIKVGLQLFKAAETHATQQHSDIQQLKDEQSRLRKNLEEDVARSLQAYDQWVGRMDENFTKALRLLEDKMGAIERRFNETQVRMDRMVKRAETLLEQSTQLLSENRREQASIRDHQKKQARVIEAQVKAHHALVARLDDMANRLPKPVSVDLPPVRTLSSKFEQPAAAPAAEQTISASESLAASEAVDTETTPTSNKFKLTLRSEEQTQTKPHEEVMPVDARLDSTDEHEEQAIPKAKINEEIISTTPSIPPSDDDEDCDPEVSYMEILDRIKNMSNNMNQAG